MAAHTASHATFACNTSSRKTTGLLAWILGSEARRRQRAALQSMTDSQLADIGLSRAEALIEADRMRWDAPIQMRLRG